MRRLVEAVLEEPSRPWGEETRKQFVIDANAILEALLLEYGVETALTALVKQGFSPTGEYRYAVEPLFQKALERRAARLAKKGQQAEPAGETRRVVR
jgi:hypothetical protein